MANVNASKIYSRPITRVNLFLVWRPAACRCRTIYAHTQRHKAAQPKMDYDSIKMNSDFSASCADSKRRKTMYFVCISCSWFIKKRIIRPMPSEGSQPIWTSRTQSTEHTQTDKHKHWINRPRICSANMRLTIITGRKRCAFLANSVQAHQVELAGSTCPYRIIDV